MAYVTDHIREEARVAIARRRISQTQLAAQVGVTRHYIGALLSGRRAGTVGVWLKVLGELGLELQVVPKEPRPG